MSQEQSSSTPRRSFPKPILTAFGSTGSLQRKYKGLIDKSGLSNTFTPETPLKLERSRFVIPDSLSPYSLSPKLLSARHLPIGKSASLRTESYLNIDFNSDSFENSYLTSPSQFSENIVDADLEFPIGHDMLDENDDIFLDKSPILLSDSEIDVTNNFHQELDNIDSESNFAFQNESWKSSKVNFLNIWELSENAFGKFKNYDNYSYFLACHNYESPEYCPDYSDYFAENFEILELIGHGCFSVVYKVRSKKDNQIFALKKTKSSFKGNSDRYF